MVEQQKSILASTQHQLAKGSSYLIFTGTLVKCLGEIGIRGNVESSAVLEHLGSSELKAGVGALAVYCLTKVTKVAVDRLMKSFNPHN